MQFTMFHAANMTCLSASRNDVREPLGGFHLHVSEQLLLGVVRNILLHRVLAQALVQVIGKLNDRGEAPQLTIQVIFCNSGPGVAG